MRTPIKAREGMILTNGEIYGTEIFLAEGMRAEDFYEIPEAEYQAIMRRQNPDYLEVDNEIPNT